MIRTRTRCYGTRVIRTRTFRTRNVRVRITRVQAQFETVVRTREIQAVTHHVHHVLYIIRVFVFMSHNSRVYLYKDRNTVTEIFAHCRLIRMLISRHLMTTSPMKMGMIIPRSSKPTDITRQMKMHSSAMKESQHRVHA